MSRKRKLGISSPYPYFSTPKNNDCSARGFVRSVMAIYALCLMPSPLPILEHSKNRIRRSTESCYGESYSIRIGTPLLRTTVTKLVYGRKPTMSQYFPTHPKVMPEYRFIRANHQMLRFRVNSHNARFGQLESKLRLGAPGVS